MFARVKLYSSTEKSVIFQSHAHIPLTQSKRKDPQHIPYYLVNFETVLRGVIDETDDAQLFDDDDHSVVKTFRNLDLVSIF
jgi:hypothetical protein